MNTFKSVLFTFLVGCMPSAWASDGFKIVSALDLQDQGDRDLAKVQQLFESGYSSIEEGVKLANKLQGLPSKPIGSLLKKLRRLGDSMHGIISEIKQLREARTEDEDYSLSSLSGSGDENQSYVFPSTKVDESTAAPEEEEEEISYPVDQMEEWLYRGVGAYISATNKNEQANAEIIIRDMFDRLMRTEGYDRDQIIEAISDLNSYESTKPLYNKLMEIINPS